MLDVEKLRLTEEEILEALNNPTDADEEYVVTAIRYSSLADAQLRKTLWGLIGWLGEDFSIEKAKREHRQG